MGEVLHVGRYALGEAIASGGMATLHLGRLVGSAGFARTVAIKRLHPHLCVDPSFVASFADEARLAARIRHPNVVPTLDVVSTEPSGGAEGCRGARELLLVMEYVDGESLAALARGTAAGRVPLPIIVAIVSEMLHGLHAAHEARSESGEPLGIVHRDVSPQNVLVGADGVARLVDFGIAKANNQIGSTGSDEVKGKLAYMAPEQIRRERVTRQTDIYCAGIVLWELLTGTRLFASDNAGATIEKILVGWVAPPSSIAKDLPRAFDDIALRALDPDPSNRFESAREMAIALEDATARALGREVAAWVEATAAPTLAYRRALVAQAERDEELPPSERASRRPPPTPVEQLETAEIVPDRIIIEAERTLTAFSAPSDRRPAASLRFPDSLAGSSAPARPRRGSADRAALAVFAAGTVMTVLIGARFANVPTTFASTQHSPPATTPVTAAQVPIAAPLADPIASPSSAVQPATAAPPHATAPAPASPARRGARPKPQAAAPPHASCVAKIDPATQKKVYQGDCD